MTAIALPVTATPVTTGADAELVKQAARADEAAFDELYRRHAQTAWRVAQAVALTPSDAALALAEGFARALRAVRRHQVPASEPFRPLLLAGVYRSAAERLRRPDQPVASTAGVGTGEIRLTSAAFRSLPDRWRTALWLSSVEGMVPERIAPVLGVSSAVASQLVVRGERGLADRFRQAKQPVPEVLGPALRPLAASLPSGLADLARTAWRAAMAGESRRRRPTAGWLGDGATRPLALAVGGVLALGLIGMGVLGQRGGLTPFGPAAANGAPSPSGTIGVRGAAAGHKSPPLIAATAANGNPLLIGTGGAASPVDLTATSATSGATTGSSTALAASAATPGTSTPNSPTPGTTSGSSPATTVPTGSNPGGGGGSSGGGTPAGGGSSPGTSSPGTTSPPATTPLTTSPPATTTTTIAPVITVAPSGGIGVDIPPVISVTIPPLLTPTTTLPITTSTTSHCVLQLNLLGIETCAL
jgi:DNA-directed RNA polymerase specialized sigma24 family protein